MRLLGPCTAGGEDFCKRGIERTGRPAATLHTSAAADATRSIRMQFVPGCYRAGRANYGANTTSVTLSRIGYRCNRHRFLRNFQSQSVPDKPQFIQPRKLRTRNPGHLEPHETARLVPGQLIAHFLSESPGQLQIGDIGPSGATGVCGVLYECSPTNVPAATVTKPRSVMNRSKSSNACS